METLKLFKSYGVLAHEKCPVYSLYAPASGVYDIIDVVVPNRVFVSAPDGMNYIVSVDGENWLSLDMCLRSHYGIPSLLIFGRYYDFELDV